MVAGTGPIDHRREIVSVAASASPPTAAEHPMTRGPRNLLTDVAGIRVGHAGDARIASGTTAIIFDEPTVVSADIGGGGPGTRETDLLDPSRTVDRIDAITLSGGSAFGLDAAGGVQAYLRSIGRGYAVGNARVPLVPAAILFDLLNGGDKEWDRYPPYRELGFAAAEAARTDFALGSVGAGLGATTVDFKGGIGSASAKIEGGFTVAALAAVNAAGGVVVGDGPWFWAAPFELDGEFGGRGFPSKVPPAALLPRTKGAPRMNTTLVVVATDAALTKAQARHLAVMAQDGFALAIHPVHTPLDGDIVFAAATGRVALPNPVFDLMAIGSAAAQVVARSIARGIFEAEALKFPGAVPSYRGKFPHPA
jgi:D-aminopeptidase